MDLEHPWKCHDCGHMMERGEFDFPAPSHENGDDPRCTVCFSPNIDPEPKRESTEYRHFIACRALALVAAEQAIEARDRYLRDQSPELRRLWVVAEERRARAIQGMIKAQQALSATV